MMGYYSAVVGVLTLVALTTASTKDNTLDSEERVVLVSPVLAPPQDSKISTVRARQFPILVLLAQRNPSENAREPQAKSLQRSPQPIYVQKLEDQEPQNQSVSSVRRLNRQRRHLLKKHLGISFGGGGYSGGGGCYSCGYQQPTYYQPPPQTVYYQPAPQPVYHQPPPPPPSQITFIIKDNRKHKNSGHGGCEYGSCGGGGHYASNPCQSSNCGSGGNYGGGGGHYGGGSPCNTGNCGGGGSGPVVVTAIAKAEATAYGKK